MSLTFYWFKALVSILTDEPNPSLTGVAAVEAWIEESVWRETDRPDRFGVETEAFPVVVDHASPRGRIRLREGSPSVLSVLEGSRAALAWSDPDHAMRGAA